MGIEGFGPAPIPPMGGADNDLKKRLEQKYKLQKKKKDIAQPQQPSQEIDKRIERLREELGDEEWVG